MSIVECLVGQRSEKDAHTKDPHQRLSCIGSRLCTHCSTRSHVVRLVLVHIRMVQCSSECGFPDTLGTTSAQNASIDTTQE